MIGNKSDLEAQVRLRFFNGQCRTFELNISNSNFLFGLLTNATESLCFVYSIIVPYCFKRNFSVSVKRCANKLTDFNTFTGSNCLGYMNLTEKLIKQMALTLSIYSIGLKFRFQMLS